MNDGSTIAKAPNGSPALEFRNISKTFVRGSERTYALRDVDLTVARGEFITVIGPSGCGKSTLLNLAAGLLTPDGGTVIQDGTTEISRVNKQVGYITQQDNLLPWATAAKNVELALRIKRIPRKERARRVRDILERVHLSDFASHYPAELSGGMRKRVALARTLVYEPETLLVDEPFAALDAQTKLAMQQQLLALWEGSGTTILFITHDLDEAILLSDRIAVMSGRPGAIDFEIQVPFERPRDALHIRGSATYSECFAKLWNALKTAEKAAA